MGLRIGYSYFYGRATTPPPDWFSRYMKDYLEEFLPAYWSKYLHIDVSVGSATFASSVSKGGRDWVQYFRALRDQVTWGEDMMMVVTDLPYSTVNPDCGCAGENFFLAKPNWGWTTMMNWEEVQALQVDHQEYDDWTAMQVGKPSDPGIRALAVVGHEMTHYVLLWMGGPANSLRIDGGDLSGLAYLNEGLNPVEAPAYIPRNFHYVAQRVVTGLPMGSSMGAYGARHFGLF